MKKAMAVLSLFIGLLLVSQTTASAGWTDYVKGKVSAGYNRVKSGAGSAWRGTKSGFWGGYKGAKSGYRSGSKYVSRAGSYIKAGARKAGGSVINAARKIGSPGYNIIRRNSSSGNGSLNNKMRSWVRKSTAPGVGGALIHAKRTSRTIEMKKPIIAGYLYSRMETKVIRRPDPKFRNFKP